MSGAEAMGDGCGIQTLIYLVESGIGYAFDFGTLKESTNPTGPGWGRRTPWRP